MQICDEKKCTACGSCRQICPVHAIDMKEDESGRRIAKIQYEKCIKCGKCRQHCPVNNPPVYHAPSQCYALRAKSSEVTAVCASGGIASTIGLYVIQEKGIYWGTKGFPVKFASCHTEIDVLETAGSKYTESSTENSYKEVYQALQRGLKVVYVGVPCQIAGLKVFLNQEYRNLLTIDLICHGMPPQSYLTEYLKNQIPQKYNKIIEVKFREPCSFIMTAYAKDELLYRQEQKFDKYLTLFLKNITFRSNCYQCPYAQQKRISDLTIGDFWGINHNTLLKKYDGNISCLLINTLNGKKIFEQIKHNFIYEERTIAEAVAGNDNLRMPSLFPKCREQFLKDYQKKGILYAISRTNASKEIDRVQRNIKIKKILYKLKNFKDISLSKIKS